MLEKTFYYNWTKKNPKPVVALTLKRGEKIINADAVVDSGADISIFNATFAEALGIPYTRSKPVPITGISTGTAKAHIYSVEAKVLDDFFPLNIAFVKDYGGVNNLLGCAGFFEKHIVTFDEPKLQLKIKKTTHSESRYRIDPPRD